MFKIHIKMKLLNNRFKFNINWNTSKVKLKFRFNYFSVQLLRCIYVKQNRNQKRITLINIYKLYQRLLKSRKGKLFQNLIK